MEGAVRSGIAAAGALLADLGGVPAGAGTARGPRLEPVVA
jgi:hypothetical protein